MSGLRVLSDNIRYGGTNRELVLARGPFAPRDPTWSSCRKPHSPRLVARIASEAGMQHFGLRRGQSLAFMSRLPMVHAQWHRPRLSRHAFLELHACLGSRLAHLWCASDVPVHAAWTERRRLFQRRLLLTSIAAHQHPVRTADRRLQHAVARGAAGHRQLPARLRALVWLSGGRVRWRTIQTVLDSGYVDAFRHCHADVLGYTFPTSEIHTCASTTCSSRAASLAASRRAYSGRPSRVEGRVGPRPVMGGAGRLCAFVIC